MDRTRTHARLMAALIGLAAGKHIGDTVTTQPLGTTTKIFTALSDAAKGLDETFDDDDLALVDRAFKRLGLQRNGNKKNEVALAVLNALVPPQRKPHKP
jgi:hypothetical protein